ncbi:PspC domain-containing protein [uncultured Corynebacterium sp.]|uniref:PspC domain-containing protein n=1 Tax=uncultured Corynebacterium sp. TaxID=159447 RepID=UPI002595045C|nr:PspC domain-containing protein [uncultured Corynebacterium sp.]
MDTTAPTPRPESSVNDTLKQLWDTRPPRIPENQGGNAMIAGVCEGIGARYGVDPVLVRLAFVALAFAFGGGIFLYLLFWLNMPLFGTTVSPWRAVNTPKDQLTAVERKQRETGWWLLVGLFVFFPSLAAGGGWAASSLVTLALGAAGMYLLHRSHPVPPEGLLAHPVEPQTTQTTQTTQAPHTTQATAPRVDTSKLTVPEGYAHPGLAAPTPPSWDPLGAAPGLWHLPDPAEPQPQEQLRKRTNPLRWILLTFAALAALAVTAAAAFGLGWATITPAEANRDIVVTDDLQDTYDTSIGSTQLDLSGLEPLAEPRDVTVDHGIGTVDIVAPKDVRVELNCDVGVGDENCPAVLNDDAGGETLRLNVDLGIGTVTVRDAA